MSRQTDVEGLMVVNYRGATYVTFITDAANEVPFVLAQAVQDKGELNEIEPIEGGFTIIGHFDNGTVKAMYVPLLDYNGNINDEIYAGRINN